MTQNYLSPSDLGPHLTVCDIETILSQWWEENDIPNRFFSRKKDCPVFCFYDGPPFATGTPHYGHLLAGSIKDAVLRYRVMKGHSVCQQFGWDTHGLPVEHEVERKLGISSKDLSCSDFISACRSVVSACDAPWKNMMGLLARWINWDESWKTMDISFMESVWWVFKQLHDKGLIYEGYKVLPFSWKLGTAISNFESGENYKEITSNSMVVQFPFSSRENTYFLAWTTTPWTLPSNLALLVHPELTYQIILDEKTGKHFCLGASRVSSFFSSFQVIETLKGLDIEGWAYLPPFHFFKDKRPNAFRVLLSSSVSDDEGTEIVHAAPGFGEDDFLACQKNGIEPVCPVSDSGCFTEEVTPFVGKNVFAIEEDIRKHLQQKDLLLSEFAVVHRHPHCWRSDTPLIYRLSESWFLSVEPFKEELVQANNSITWFPSHIREGRFGKWLAQARDWSISRKRIWGNPLPVWRSREGDTLVMGSRQDLLDYSGKAPDDLHRDQLDQISFTYQGKTFNRIDGVFDCWFESGCVPFGQNHYPFSKKSLEEIFPADFIAEGIDQTRGWFYTLHVLSVLLTGKTAFRNVIVNGIVLAENGMKMSKRLKNYPNPEDLILKYGADALRLYLFRSVAVKAENLFFSEEGVVSVMRQVILPLRSALLFFSQNRREDVPCFQKGDPVKHVLDLWILSRLACVLQEMNTGFEAYDISSATSSFADLVDDLNNWYIRLSRVRFKQDVDVNSIGILQFFLSQLARLLAPVIPFLAEEIYLNTRDSDVLSVHLNSFPCDLETNTELEKKMIFLREIVQVGHSLRKRIKIRVRQPLSSCYVSTDSHSEFIIECSELIESELNIKKIVLVTAGHFTVYSLRPNFRILGQRLGQKVKLLKPILENMTQENISLLLQEKEHSFELEGEFIDVFLHELFVEQRPVKGVEIQSGNGFSLSFDTVLNDQLLSEGAVREFISKLNLTRKGQGLLKGHAITLRLAAGILSRPALEKEQNFIQTTCSIEKIIWTKKEHLQDPISSLEGEWFFSFQIDQSNKSFQGFSDKSLSPDRTM